MVHMEEFGQDVSSLTFRNVSCFVFIAFGLAQGSVAFPAVRKCSLNEKQKVAGRRLFALLLQTGPLWCFAIDRHEAAFYSACGLLSR